MASLFCKEGGFMKNNQQNASEEMILYAGVLEQGMYTGLLLMFVTFLLYSFGVLDPVVPLNELTRFGTNRFTTTLFR